MKLSVPDELAKIEAAYTPKILAEINGHHIKIARLEGAFIWHHHEHEDEFFYVVSGRLRMKFRDREEVLLAGDGILIPKGVEHLPVAEDFAEVMLFEPATTRNTGNEINDRTRDNLDRV